MAVRDIDLRTRLPKNIFLSRDFQLIHPSIRKSVYVNGCLLSTDNQCIRLDSQSKFQMYRGHGGSILGSVNLFKIFRGISELWENAQT